MKKTILKISGCALALGLLAAPSVNAAQPDSTCKNVIVKKEVKKDVIVKKVVKKEIKGKEEVKKLTAKEKAALKLLNPLNKNVVKVETEVTKITKMADDFYAEPTTKMAEKELFYRSVSKLHQSSLKLDVNKKQLEKVMKKYGKTAEATALKEKIAALKTSIKNEKIKLMDLHKKYLQAQAVTQPAPTQPTLPAPTTEQPAPAQPAQPEMPAQPTAPVQAPVQ